MKINLAISLACAFLLTGCGSAQPQAITSPTAAPATAQASPTPTATPTPTPTAMTDEAAGQYFLDTICPANKLSIPLAAAFRESPVNLQTAKAAAAAYRNALASSAKELANPTLPWPATVKADVDGFVTDLYSEISDADTVAGQTNLTNLISANRAWKDSGAGAKAQAVRVKLGLPSDARASCGM